MCALLDINKNMHQNDAQYVRVLAMNNIGSKLLSGCRLPLVCKYPQDYNKLSNIGKAMFDIDIKATDVFSLSICNSGMYINELKSQIIKN